MQFSTTDPCTVIDFDELAERLSVSRPTLSRMRSSGNFPPVVAVSKRRRGVLLTDLRTWLESRREVVS